MTLHRWFGRSASDRDSDPWGGSGGCYAADLRLDFEDIAVMLSRGGFAAVRTRFNRKQKCVELYDSQDGLVLASVVVVGEDSKPSDAIVTLHALSESAKSLFTGNLPVSVTFT